MSTENTPPDPQLTPEQLDGQACIVCGAHHRPMIPVPGIETATSSHVFVCVGCQVTPGIHRTMEQNGLSRKEGASA